MLIANRNSETENGARLNRRAVSFDDEIGEVVNFSNLRERPVFSVQPETDKKIVEPTAQPELLNVQAAANTGKKTNQSLIIGAAVIGAALLAVNIK